MKFSQAVLLSAFATSQAFVCPPSVVSRPRSHAAAFAPPLFSTAAAAEKETYEFTSDVGRVMDLIINSLYSDKDIFLRELISNAADACDKKRFLSLTSSSDEDGSTPTTTSSEIGITIRCNADENTLTIQDAGVGMTKEELINNLGKIAQSGTAAFAKALGDSKSSDEAVTLIGQFGVGFYSAYLVADKVEVITKSMQDGAKQYKWTSQANSSYTIEQDDDSDDPIQGSGTRLVLHLKEEAAQYLETSTIEELLQRYSEYIEFPISLYKETTEYVQVPDDEANKDLPEGEEPKMKTVPQTKEGYEQVNNNKPIWLRPPRQVAEEDYKEFYKSAFRSSYDEPMKWTHFVLEGQVECKALLYIPGMLPFELSKDMFDENARNLRLYVKRVFINDKFEDLMPRWLKFVRGVVDSNDLPLNVSREILQKSKVLSIINKRLVRKSLDMMRELADGVKDEESGEMDTSQYILFWNNFGKYLKVGIIEDDQNRKEIAPLLRFFSSKSGDEYTSLDEYVANMPDDQKAIYYVTGDGKENVKMSPAIEKLAKRGYDVLFATEPLDEIMLESLRNYKEKDVVDAAKENLQLEETEDDKKKKEELEAQLGHVVEYLQTLLSDKVQKVKVSTELIDSPAALVQGAYGMSPTMQRYMRAQAVAGGADQDMLGGMNKAVLEINPNHSIIKDLDRMVKDDKESADLEEFAMLMYDVASMTSGYEVANMRSFASRVLSLMDEKATRNGTSATEEGDAAAPTTATSTAKPDEEESDEEAVTPEVL